MSRTLPLLLCVFTASTIAHAQSTKPGLWDITQKMGGNAEMDKAMAQMQQQMAGMSAAEKKMMGCGRRHGHEGLHHARDGGEAGHADADRRRVHDHHHLAQRQHPQDELRLQEPALFGRRHLHLQRRHRLHHDDADEEHEAGQAGEHDARWARQVAVGQLRYRQTAEVTLAGRLPNTPRPTRTIVDPAATAASRSSLMPMDKVSSARP